MKITFLLNLRTQVVMEESINKSIIKMCVSNNILRTREGLPEKDPSPGAKFFVR